MSTSFRNGPGTRRGTPIAGLLTATPLVLAASWLFAWVPPHWVLSVANPIAWIASRTGLLQLHPGFFVGVAQTIETPGRWLGHPVSGACIVVLLISAGLTRSGRISGTIEALAVLLSLPFVAQLALLSLAERARAGEVGIQVPTQQRLEAKALLATVSISRDAGCPGVFYSDDWAVPLFRLAELEAIPSLRDLFERPQPVAIHYGKTSISMSSDVLAFPAPSEAGLGSYFRSFRELAKARFREPIAIDELAGLSIGDVRAQLGLNMLIAFDGVLSTLRLVDPESYNRIIANGVQLSVQVERAGDESLSRRPARGEGNADAEGWARFENQRIYVALPEASYLRGFKGMMGGVSSLVAQSAQPVLDPSVIPELSQFGDLWVARVVGPVSHEVWHAVSFASRRHLGSLPAALDEGLACSVQILTEQVIGAAQAVNTNDPVKMKEFQGSLNMAKLVGTSPTEKAFLDALKRASINGKLVGSRDLFNLGDRIYERADVFLIYAEGWSLGLSLGLDPSTLRDALVSWTGGTWSAPSDPHTWDTLDAEIVQNPASWSIAMGKQ